MLEYLYSFFIKSTRLHPEYNPKHCLAVTQKAGGCDLCAQACPHNAITIKKQVEIDDVDCTGCGICTQVCPSEALEPTTVSYQKGTPLRCSQVSGNAPSIQCLAQLSPTDLIRLASIDKSNKGSIQLFRNDCADCPVGAGNVPHMLEANLHKAQELANLFDRKLIPQITQTTHHDFTDDSHAISRRELLRGGWQSVKQQAADALAPLELLTQEDNDARYPTEHRKRLQLVKLAQPENDTLLTWAMPEVADNCIVCPICTKVCPTGAFSRIFTPSNENDKDNKQDNNQGGKTLWLEPEACNGCNACQDSCPVNAIAMTEHTTWEILNDGKQVVHHKPNNPAAANNTSGDTTEENKSNAPVPIARGSRRPLHNRPLHNRPLDVFGKMPSDKIPTEKTTKESTKKAKDAD